MNEIEFTNKLINAMIVANKEMHYSKKLYESVKNTFITHSKYIWNHIYEESALGNYDFCFSKEDIEKETGYAIITDIDEMKIIADYFTENRMFNGEINYYGFKFDYFRGTKKCYKISWGINMNSKEREK